MAILAILAACSGSDHGELVGVQNRPEFYPSDPYGMVYIPQGSFNMGNSDFDVPSTMTAPTKTVSVGSFYMDETEITNNEYRQFVHWVRDSILRIRLAEEYKSMGLAELEYYEYSGLDDIKNDAYAEYLDNKYGAADSVYEHLDWDRKLEWDPNRFRDPAYVEVIQSMYLPIEETPNGGRMLDARQLNYQYFWLDREMAARKSNRFRNDFKDEDGDGKTFYYDGANVTDRSSFFKSETINIYPDTLVWVADWTYGYNDNMHDNYFWHPAYDNYPVVGISWKQAMAFCNWRTSHRNEYLRDQKDFQENEYRLPTEAEWEYAARGGFELTTYPWGGPYTTNSQGCFLANFKVSRGNLTADGGLHTVKVTSFEPNGYGLYNMAGNVAEWTSSAWDEVSYYYVADFNPDFRYNADEVRDSETRKRKVIRGGSWKDIAAYMQVGSRDYEYQDTTKSYIGFRTVQSFLGRDARDF
jgi:formylglycine-generating enzyme required for sulfatase activity